MQERIQAKDVLHNLKKFVVREERAFPFDHIDGKKYAYFVKDGKKYYFKHPARPEFDLTDDTIAAMYQSEEYVNIKSSIFKKAQQLKDPEAKPGKKEDSK